MNKMDRLLAIVLELRGRGWRRAEDLATTFETSKRTIYRDLRALGQAGVPVFSIPGRGYSLVEGYFLPPLSFTVEEATMLLLGGDVMAQSFDAQYRAAAESASLKIAGVLPERIREEVGALREGFQFVIEAGGADRDGRLRKLQVLRRAILDRRTVRFGYLARHRSGGAAPAEAPEAREADPYGLVHLWGTWYLVAYCHTRKGQRTFRLDRMDTPVVLDATFIRPADFHMRGRGRAARDVVVRALFAPEITRWVRESQSFFAVREEETPDGLLVSFAVREERELLQWLLGWGRNVRVLAPESLRQLIAAEADVMRREHASPTSFAESPEP